MHQLNYHHMIQLHVKCILIHVLVICHKMDVLIKHVIIMVIK